MNFDNKFIMDYIYFGRAICQRSDSIISKEFPMEAL